MPYSVKLLQYLDMKLGALGARWGYDSEGAFREAVKHILQDTDFRVEHYQGTDKEGSVFVRSEQVELDLIIKNGKVIVAEIKSSVNKADISVYEKKVRHYEKETKREVTDKVIISPFIDPRGSKALADAFNIKLIMNPEDVC